MIPIKDNYKIIAYGKYNKEFKFKKKMSTQDLRNQHRRVFFVSLPLFWWSA